MNKGIGMGMSWGWGQMGYSGPEDAAQWEEMGSNDTSGMGGRGPRELGEGGESF